MRKEDQQRTSITGAGNNFMPSPNLPREIACSDGVAVRYNKDASCLRSEGAGWLARAGNWHACVTAQSVTVNKVSHRRR